MFDNISGTDSSATLASARVCQRDRCMTAATIRGCVHFAPAGAISNTMLKHTENGMRQGADSPDEQGRVGHERSSEWGLQVYIKSKAATNIVAA